MQQITGYSSNKAFTNQMLGQQLLIQLGKELGLELQGYYKYHKITVFSTDSHLNHQIFVRKGELIEKLIDRAHKTFGITVKIKDIVFIARSVVTDTGDALDADVGELGISDRYDGEDL